MAPTLSRRELLKLGLLALSPAVLRLRPHAAPSPQSASSWRDDFDSSTLDPAWSWVREDPSHWSLTANPGHMRILTQAGGVFGPGNNQHNLLLAAAPAGDFQIATQVTIAPSENFQHATLLVYQDDDNYVQVSRLYADGQKVQIKAELGGATASTYWDTAATTLYLRLVKEGDDYAGSFSLDGETWTLIGQVNDLALSNLQVGIGAMMGPVPVSVTADYDSFAIEYNQYIVFLPLVVR